MARYIHSAVGETKLEVVRHVEGKGVVNIRLSNDEFELNRTLSEKQLYALYRDLKQYHDKIQHEKPYVAKVNFNGIDGSTNTKTYHFLSEIKDLQVGEYVFVDSDGKNQVGKFEGYVNLDWIEPTKYVIKRATPITTFI